MGFRINTNVAAMTAHMYATQNNLGLDKSLASLSSGLRINSAADDASGLAIANQLKSQANGLGQAIKNANDGINVAQTADGALSEYSNIINTVRTKAIQAASDGQNANSRKAIQSDISKLLQEAQNIATTTSFNGQNLLDGTFVNKNFQIGAYANQTVGISIGSAKIENIGGFAEGTGSATAAPLVAGDLTVNGTAIIAAVAGNGTGRTTTSAWAMANSINASASETGVTASASTTQTGSDAVTAGNIAAGDLLINGVDIGTVAVSANDSDSALMDAINAKSGTTFVTASLDAGKLVLKSDSGSSIVLSGANSTDAIAHLGDNATGVTTNGNLTLTSTDGSIQLGGANEVNAGFTDNQVIGKTENLGTVNVSTYDGAQKAIKIADAALKGIDGIRSTIGSVQNQLQSTVSNISVTQVNVTAAQSTIMDVDFASESANFSKHNILAQSGSYAMSQANTVQQNVLKLLQ